MSHCTTPPHKCTKNAVSLTSNRSRWADSYTSLYNFFSLRRTSPDHRCQFHSLLPRRRRRPPNSPTLFISTSFRNQNPRTSPSPSPSAPCQVLLSLYHTHDIHAHSVTLFCLCCVCQFVFYSSFFHPFLYKFCLKPKRGAFNFLYFSTHRSNPSTKKKRKKRKL